MKPPVVQFKKKSMKLYEIFKKQKSSKSLSTQLYVICKSIKKNVKKKRDESFLELICCIFYFEFQE